MSDYFQNAALEFQKLLNIQYNFIIGYKNNEIHINLTFSDAEFHHLAGLQYLNDIRYIRRTKRPEIFKKICQGTITDEYLSKSPAYGEVLQRVSDVKNLENFLDSNETVFRFKKSANPYSNISADFILKNHSNGINTYFCIQQGTNGLYFGKSIFSRSATERDYTLGHTQCTLLYKEKVDLLTKEKQILYTNPSYKIQHSSQLQQPPNNNVKIVKFDSPVPSDILPNASGAAVIPAPNPFRNIFEQIKEGFKNLFNKQDKPVEHSAIDPAEEEKPVSDTYSSHSEPETEPVPEHNIEPKELADMCTAREEFIKGNITADDYKNSILKCINTFNSKKQWENAIDLLREQLRECPEKQERLITNELNNFERIFKKHYPPKQTLSEIKRNAAQEYARLQNEKKTVDVVSNRNDRGR